MLTMHALSPIQTLNLSQAISDVNRQIKQFSARPVTARFEVQKVVAQAKRRRAIRMARGSLSHVPGGVEEFLSRKREDIERENLRFSLSEVTE